MRYHPLDSAMFSLNRKRFMRKMQSDSIAIFHSNDLKLRNGNTFFPFRQNAGLFYLSGLDQPESVVVLFPDCIKEGFQEVAFIKRSNEFTRQWEGTGLTIETAREVSGIDRIYWLDEMELILHELILLAKRIYINTEEHDRMVSPVESRNMRFAKKLMAAYPAHKYHRSQPILKKLMMIKLPQEIELIQQSIKITERAFRRVLSRIRPGMMEYEIEAEVAHEFISNRAGGFAYDPVIASGPRACIMHYSQNNQICLDGEMVLLDIGAEYANYAADLTRTIPVNGRFTERQKAVYEAVLKVLDESQQLLVPGTLLEEYNREVGKVMESTLIDLGLLTRKQIEQQDPNFPAYKKYFMHAPSHHLGLGVHDLANRYDPIQAGMVLTCEPGIYIPEEQLGIRLENDILVTDEGPFDLMHNVPIEIKEIEELMNSEVLQDG